MRTNITTKNTTTYTLTEADFKRALEAIGVTFSSDTGLAFKQKIDYTKELELTDPGMVFLTVTTVAEVPVAAPVPTPPRAPVTEADIRPGTVVRLRLNNNRYTLDRSTSDPLVWRLTNGGSAEVSTLLDPMIYTLVSVRPLTAPPPPARKTATLCGVNAWSDTKGNIDVYRLDPPLADGTEYVTPCQIPPEDVWVKAEHTYLGSFSSYSGTRPDPKALSEYAGLPAKPSSPRDPKALVPGCVVEVDYGRGNGATTGTITTRHRTPWEELGAPVVGWDYKEPGSWDRDYIFADPKVCRIVSWPAPVPT